MNFRNIYLCSFLLANLIISFSSTAFCTSDVFNNERLPNLYIFSFPALTFLCSVESEILKRSAASFLVIYSGISAVLCIYPDMAFSTAFITVSSSSAWLSMTIFSFIALVFSRPFQSRILTSCDCS